MHTSTRKWTIYAGIAASASLASCSQSDAQKSNHSISETPEIHGDRLQSFEAQYESSQGSTFSLTLRESKGLDGQKLWSALIENESSYGFMADHTGLSGSTLALVYRQSPYFAMGQDFLLAWYDGSNLDAVLHPIGGGSPIYRQVELSSPVYEPMLFALPFAAMDLAAVKTSS